MKNRSLLISCSNRSEYGLIRPLIRKLNGDFVNITTVTLLLFSDAVDSCKTDAQRDCSPESTKIELMAPSLRRGNESIAEHFARLVTLFSGNFLSHYDGVLIAGDRYENFALTTGCFFNQIPMFHFFGGDISDGGHFDDHLRHAISQLASVHFPVNESAKNHLLACKQEPSRIFHIGSPVIDEIAIVGRDNLKQYDWNIILSFNPMTLGPRQAVGNSIKATLEAIDDLSKTIDVRCLVTRPNNESGSSDINELINAYSGRPWLEVADSLGSPAYLYAIKNALLVVGNSSGQLLEVPVLGTHSLLIGDRQKGRHAPGTVSFLSGAPTKMQIKEKIKTLLQQPRPVPCDDYGREGVTDSIVLILDKLMGLSKAALVAKSTPLDFSHAI